MLTNPQGEVTFGSLPVEQRRHAESFLRGLYASDTRRGNLELSVVCRAGEARPRIVMKDELRQREEETERARAEAHFDSRPYGRELAREVAAFVDTRGPLGFVVDPRDSVSHAFWKRADGTYAYGERYFEDREAPWKTFSSQEEFIGWLASCSDEFFAKERAPEDPQRWGLNAFNRDRILALLAGR